MSITAAMVKELRERTGAGMMECKKALQEVDGNMDEAVTVMRKRGQAKAAKRAGKIAAEGVVEVAVSADHKRGYIVEVNSETDFVARDENFTNFTGAIVDAGLRESAATVEALLGLESAHDQFANLEAEREHLVHKIGENVQVRRVELYEADGVIGAYKHGTRIGVLVSLTGGDAEFAKDLAMHIAAMNPLAIDEHHVSKEIIAKERDIYTTQAKESGKPDNVIEKMVDGRIKKFFKENCLLEQTFIRDPDLTIAKLLEQKQASVTAFVRFEVGEGIEKETVDFADEVRAQVKGSE